MYLLIVTTILSFLNVSTSLFTKPLIKWLNKPTSKEVALHQEITELLKTQSQISMVDNFAAHAKIQRKINAIKLKLDSTSNNRFGEKYKNQFSITLGSKIIVSLMVLYLIYNYRFVPVYIFPKEYNLFPLTSIMSYPTNIPGSVTVHFWLLVSNYVARNLIKT